MKNPHRIFRAAAIVALAARSALAGGAGGGGLPWETPLHTVALSLTGPVALAISIIALMVAGGTLVFGGELSEFARRACLSVLAIAFLVAGTSFMSILFGVGGAVV
jgi:type IV secretion system protein VirB2